MDKKIVLIILAIVFPLLRILKIWRQQKPRHQHSALPIFLHSWHSSCILAGNKILARSIHLT